MDQNGRIDRTACPITPGKGKGCGQILEKAQHQRAKVCHTHITQYMGKAEDDHGKYIGQNGRTVIDPILDALGRDMDELEHAYLREEQKITVHRALAALKPDYSRVLYLKFFEELENDQIAAIMRRNRRQVENLLYQAKLSLKAELEKEGFHYEGL